MKRTCVAIKFETITNIRVRYATHIHAKQQKKRKNYKHVYKETVLRYFKATKVFVHSTYAICDYVFYEHHTHTHEGKIVRGVWIKLNK